MNYELEIRINGATEKAFVQNDLAPSDSISPIIHNHSYAEIHIILDGNAVFYVGNALYTLSRNECFIIPAGVYHCKKSSGDSIRHVAFQVTESVAEPASYRLSDGIVAELFNVFSRVAEGDDSTALSSLMSYVCSGFFGSSASKIKKMSDTSAIIREFISHNYSRDIHLTDLAEELHFSEKQTERLVKKHLGMTFKELLTDYRMTVADFLAKSTELSEREIAEYVGYSTYNGYWKAKKRYLGVQ